MKSTNLSPLDFVLGCGFRLHMLRPDNFREIETLELDGGPKEKIKIVAFREWGKEEGRLRLRFGELEVFVKSVRVSEV